MATKIKYYCDDARHLICVPYSVENLHKMAEELNIKRCWFHNGKYPHYDMPKRRIEEIKAKCEVITSNQLLLMIKVFDNGKSSSPLQKR